MGLSFVRNRKKVGISSPRRLYHEALDFMKLRADRRKVAKAGQGVDKKAIVTVPAVSSTAGESVGA
jgi:hypothetical protein